MNPSKKIRVLVVDDSAVVRRVISEGLGRDAELEVVGTACDPFVARDQILERQPDVVTLDIEMPRMDGLSFLRILQKHHPLPVVIVSSTTPQGSKAAIEALAAGAVDVIAKPFSTAALADFTRLLCDRIKAAARASLVNLQPGPKKGRDAIWPLRPTLFDPRQLILIGASTGGTEAIKNVLIRLPGGLPAICIVQHIPAGFSKAFAEALNRRCAFEVREAQQGELIRSGVALVAPGDYHMSLTRDGTGYRVALDQNPPRHHTRPAVDVLFESAARCAGPGAIAVLLTGMGSDGAIGMKALKQRGAATIAQDEATCIVYGMPRAAVELGVVDHVLALEKIPEEILHSVHQRALAISAGQMPPQAAQAGCVGTRNFQPTPFRS